MVKSLDRPTTWRPTGPKAHLRVAVEGVGDGVRVGDLECAFGMRHNGGIHCRLLVMG